jgi:hypothetical protein
MHVDDLLRELPVNGLDLRFDSRSSRPRSNICCVSSLDLLDVASLMRLPRLPLLHVENVGHARSFCRLDLHPGATVRWNRTLPS